MISGMAAGAGAADTARAGVGADALATDVGAAATGARAGAAGTEEVGIAGAG